MARDWVRESQQLSRFGVLVAQLESIVASAAHKTPDPIMCFDLLSDLISAVEEEPKESILQTQRRGEDALYSLLVLGARRPVRHLASVAMAKIILKGDGISIYSRTSTLQGFLSDGKRSEAQKAAGVAQCLGELYHHFGRRILSGFLETVNIATKLLKFTEDFVRREALHMLYKALEGSEGNAAPTAYSEAFRVIMRVGVWDKSSSVKIAAARCLKAFANIGGPSLGTGELENCLFHCVKALEDPVKSVRDAFSEALGVLLGLGMNLDLVQPRGKVNATPKKLEGGLQKHLVNPFTKAIGPRFKEMRVGISLSWVCFLQTVCLKYLHPDSELQNYTLQVMEMLRSDASIDAQALACVLYIMRVGITDQMSEPTQRSFSVFLANQLVSSDSTPSMRVSALRTLAYVLKTLGEVPPEFKEVLDDTVVAALSHQSPLVRVEAALTLRALAEVDPSCVGGLISYAVTMLNAAREIVLYEKGSNFKRELDSLHGQASALASLVSISQKLPLGYPTRLPKTVLEVCKNLLNKPSRNHAAAAVEKEAGWNLLSSLLNSIPKDELQDQVFDILALWASTFSGDPKQQINLAQDLASEICVWSAAIDALTSYVKCFVSSDSENRGILLHPVLYYLSGALSYVSQLAGKEQPGIKSSMNLFIIRLLLAYQTVSEPSLYKSDHAQIIQICTTPFREPTSCDESSCLRMLLDKRDAWLGPWTPGRDWFEDELRSFQGGKDGVLTCAWEDEPPSFPQPETINKMLVNQMLLCFGTIFASQDSSAMLSYLGMIDHCLKAGKNKAWHASSVTNICVGLLAGLKALLAQRAGPLGMEVLSAAQTIFQNILAEGDICASQRRACSEGLGLLARLGNDMFTARLTKQCLGDAAGNIDFNYAGSIALALGCIHRSAGGMALSSLVPTTVSVVSSLAKSSISSLQIWSLHGLLLTIEAAGLSYTSQVQATLGLVMEIIISEESGWVDLQQAVGRLINAIVAVIGPELAPGSNFFSRCKECALYTTACAVCTTGSFCAFSCSNSSPDSILKTALRHLALSTLRHLIEKDPDSIIDEQIEETFFHMLDEETDRDIGNLAQSTIMRLLYASCPSRPSRWLSICHNMILSTSSKGNKANNSSVGLDGEKRLNFGEDDENMVSSSTSNFSRDKHLRYRTRVFASECLNHLPEAVGENPAHFDLSLARRQPSKGPLSGDWLVLQLQELISLAYQISTIQFEKMRPIGVSLLCTIMDKFAAISDPELPDHLLLEQYQAQLMSAVRSALDSLSGPILLEAGLQLATKMLTSGIISRDQAAVKRIFSLISRPLDDFNDLYYPSYAEWVSCKIKVRLLTVHASLKCYMFAFIKEQGDNIPDEYLALLPLFANSSSILGVYWLSFLKDYCYIHFHVHPENWKPFLDGIQSSAVSVQLQPCLEEAWPVILQALALDAVPANSYRSEYSTTERSNNIPSSGYSMVELKLDDFQFLWGFLLLVLFQKEVPNQRAHMVSAHWIKSKFGNDISEDDSISISSKLNNIFIPVFQCLSTERFFNSGFLTLDSCKELLQVFSYLIFGDDSWDSLAVYFLSQVVQNCPKDFLLVENFAYVTGELCLTSLFIVLLSGNLNSQYPSKWEKTLSVALIASSTLLERLEAQLDLFLPFLLLGYKFIGEASNEITLSRISDFVQSIASSLKRLGNSEFVADGTAQLVSVTRSSLHATATLTSDCVREIHLLENKRTDMHKMLLLKLACSVEQLFSYTALAFDFTMPYECKEHNPILSRLLHLGIQSIRNILSDSNMQIQAVGLQVIKVKLQKGLAAECNDFLIFFVGELIEDLFIILEKILENPITREAVAVAGECLKILMLLQTFLKGSEYQKCSIHLFLEAILMILSTSDGFLSQEANDLRNISINFVSQLAQIPSAAAHFRDILLAMPAAQRQKLQDIIRASVIQDKNPKPISAGPPLVIKLPSQSAQNEEKKSPPLESPKASNDSGIDEEEDEDEEDDWDTFQSFPASGNETAPAPALDPEAPASMSDTNTRDSGFHASVLPSPSKEENLYTEELKLGEAAREVQVTDGSNQMEESPNLEDDELNASASSIKAQMELSNEDDQPSSDIPHTQSTDLFLQDIGPSHENVQDFPDPKSPEFPAELAEPSSKEGTVIPGPGNTEADHEQVRPTASTVDSDSEVNTGQCG
ncbi:protein SWEETIE isoform X2 [Andrographis paniculata]|uniref:protein SWEETIE isoform X2 n=1 Tax=Andrographis paniculata TaxID=175694 RepID=UPI0021E75720|nr:protein SWEETIE isoform X2 [Andrographis paniculata]